MLASLVAISIAATPAPIAEHQAACAGKDGWSDPAPPVRVIGNTYNVGTCGIVALLIAGDKGHVLIDGATEKAAPSIARNIERLGFRLGDVRLILASHEHYDHVGGLAELQRLTGATVRLSPVATRVMTVGRVDAADPQATSIEQSPVLNAGPALGEGETVRVGPLALTAHFTPGHAPGGTSWTWRSCEDKRCLSIAYADGVGAVAPATYRFLDHPDRIEALRTSFATVATLPCDVLISPHPAFSELYERLAGARPLADPKACARYAAVLAENLGRRLERERAAK